MRNVATEAETTETTSNRDTMQAITIIRAIEDVSGLKWADILKPNRKQIYSDYRHMAAYFLRFKGELKTAQVAAIIQRDHATVIHAAKKIHQLVGIDLMFSAKFAAVEKRLSYKCDTTKRPWRTAATYERARRICRPAADYGYWEWRDNYGRVTSNSADRHNIYIDQTEID